MTREPGLQHKTRRGASIVEFAIVSFVLLCLLFGGIEAVRALFVYTNLADAAKAGVRYAITHGSDRAAGSGEDGASTAGDYHLVTDRIKGYASGFDLSQLNITVTYEGNDNTPGRYVDVLVQYTYSPLTALPLFQMSGFKISASSRGIITF
jgi:Flp pilus assembly protein TadG